MNVNNNVYILPDHKLDVVHSAFARLGVPQFMGEVKNWTIAEDSDDWSICWSWRSLEFGYLSQLTPHHRLNHIPGTAGMLRKSSLFETLLRLQLEHGVDQFRLMASQFNLPEQVNDFKQAFHERETLPVVNQKRAAADPMFQRRWLIKSQNHRGISFFPGLHALPKIMHTNSMVAEYIEPLLIGGHKFDIGIYVTVTSIDPLRIYIYNIPKIRFCVLPYPEILDETAELLSYVVTEKFIPPWQNPALKRFYTSLPSETDPGPDDMKILKMHLDEEDMDGERFERELYSSIVKIVMGNRQKFLNGVKNMNREWSDLNAIKENFFEFWRFDFIVDDDGRPFVTEANQSPNMVVYRFPEDGSTDHFLKSNLIYDLLNMISTQNSPLPDLPVLDEAACSENCLNRIEMSWNMECWSCPGWYSQSKREALHRTAIEYSNRGRYRLIYPEIGDSQQTPPFHTFLDSESGADKAVRQYFASLSSHIAPNSGESPMVCSTRTQCNNQGDCYHGTCRCDCGFEGTICNRLQLGRRCRWGMDEMRLDTFILVGACVLVTVALLRFYRPRFMNRRKADGKKV